jgi:hypothetical protein
MNLYPAFSYVFKVRCLVKEHRGNFSVYLFTLQFDSKFLSGFPFIGHGNLDNTLESPCIFLLEKSCAGAALIFEQVRKNFSQCRERTKIAGI